MKGMNPILLKLLGFLPGWSGDGPWRSKSVMAALAAIVVGGGLWISGVKSGPPQNAESGAAINPPATMTTGATGDPGVSHWDWSRPLPVYLPACASYVAGFCIGWFFRKLIRITVVVAALVITLLAMGKYAGCDTTPAQERVKRGGEWAQHQATVTQVYLLHLLPSATGGGAGIFLGFRRRSKSATIQPVG
jgi:uncharacterized membrane protein (Fun14 family)